MQTKYMNPYLAGVLLGLVLLAANFVSGRGLGASGAIKDTVAAGVKAVAPSHYYNAPYYSEFIATQRENPMHSWLVYQMLGVITGGFLSGVLAGRMKLQIERPPHVSSRKRLMFALAGGILFGYGSQIGRGCTSGSALSGMAVLSFGGFITMAAIFGTAFALAWFFRKNWI